MYVRHCIKQIKGKCSGCTVSKSLGERSIKMVESAASATAAAAADALAAAAAIEALSPNSNKREPGTAQRVFEVVSNSPPLTFRFMRGI